MTNTLSGAASAPTHMHAVHPDVLHPKLDGLCHQVLTSNFGSAALMDALASGLSDVSSLLRGLPAAEGRLIERGIQMIAGLIRPLTDQNPLAHSLRPIDMTRHGWLSSRRQASQQ